MISYNSKSKILDFINRISKDVKFIIIENSKDKDLKKQLKHKKNKNILKDNIGYGPATNYARTKLNTKYFLYVIQI